MRWRCSSFSTNETETLNWAATVSTVRPDWLQAAATRSRKSSEYAFIARRYAQPVNHPENRSRVVFLSVYSLATKVILALCVSLAEPFSRRLDRRFWDHSLASLVVVGRAYASGSVVVVISAGVGIFLPWTQVLAGEILT